MYRRNLPVGHENVTYSHEFELRYLRWDFLVKSENPPAEYMERIEEIIRPLSQWAYNKYKYDFCSICMDRDDVQNTARVYGVSAWTFFVQKNANNIEEALKDIRKYKVVKMFVKQRLTEMAYVCRQKNKLNVGYNDINIFYISNLAEEEYKQVNEHDLNYNLNKTKWKKAGWSLISKIKKKFKNLHSNMSFIFEDKLIKIVCRNENLVDLDSQFDTIEEMYSYTPHEQQIEINEELNKFDLLNDQEKAEWLADKLKDIKDSKVFFKKEDVRAIKRMIKSLQNGR